MFKVYLLIAWRNIFRQKGYTPVNLLGLIAGMTTFLLITQHVLYEKNYDTQSDCHEDIYRINLLVTNQGIPEYKTALNYPGIGPDLVQTFPRIKNYCRLYSMQSSFTRAVSFQDANQKPQIFNEDHIYYTHPEFFELFPFQVRGNHALLRQPHTAILSSGVAEKYFGNEDPIGKTVTFRHSNGENEYAIIGVMDVPENTHLNLNILLSYSSLAFGPLTSKAFSNWSSENAYTYLQLDPGTIPEELEKDFKSLIKDKTGSDDTQFALQGISDIHTGIALLDEPKPTVNIRNLNFLLVGVGLLLIISMINYVNILLGNIPKRKKSVYMGLINGATRPQMFQALFIEFLLLSFFAFIISSCASYFFVGFDIFRLPRSLLFFLFLSLIGLLVIAAICPAYFMTYRRKEINITNSKSLTGLSLGLQFFICISLIITTLIVNRQLDYVKNRDLGFNANNLLVIKGPASTDFADSTTTLSNESFKNELLNNPQVINATYSGIIPGMENSWITEATVPRSDKSIDVSFNIINENFPETYEIAFLAGRAFNKSDQRSGKFGERIESVILNRTAAQNLGLSDYENAIGRQLIIFERKCKLIGIIEDFHQQSFHLPVRPAAFFLDKNASLYFSIRLTKTAEDEVIDQVRTTYSQFFPGNPFEHFMIDDSFYAQYDTEKTFFQLFAYLSGIAILISCLGLLSISIQYAARRIKEIGIRKVNGAELSEILILLNKDFVKWIFIAFLIAIPTGWYAMDLWLQNFAYKTEQSWWMFVLAGLATISIALLSVSWQSWKAATRNPVEALRDE